MICHGKRVCLVTPPREAADLKSSILGQSKQHIHKMVANPILLQYLEIFSPDNGDQTQLYFRLQ